MIQEKSDCLRKPSRAEWTVCIGIFSFLFFCFQYVDFESLTIWSTNLWDVIFQGDVANFYVYTAENHRGLYHTYMGSSLFYILPWAIWNLPIALIQYFLNVDVLSSAPMMAWSRLFLVLALLVTLKYTYKISMIVINDEIKSQWAVFLSFSSFFVYFGILYTGQNDIIMVCLSVIGVYYYLKSNQRCFILFFALSIAVKPFSLLIFVPLLLLREKKIHKIAIALIAVSSFIAISTFVTYLMPLGMQSQIEGPNISTIHQILRITYIFDTIPFSVFGFLYAVICLLCFLYKQKNEDELCEYSIYIAAATYLLLFVFSQQSPYRTLFLVPFFYIMIVKKAALIKSNVILEIFTQIFYFIYAYIWLPWLFNPQILRNSVYLKILELPHKLPRPVITEHFMPEFITPHAVLFSRLFKVCMLMLVIINFPKLDQIISKIKAEGIVNKIKDFQIIRHLFSDRLGRSLILIRFAAFLPFIICVFYYYVRIYM